ncbi:uncharacterized protein VTP21DRAFT_9315 [Calcarisporiella thermophila]|uniref:uncharacterized protein n=1 Tax=Calcarisporiella thermophila TaxID=911321 RepID=UPI0037440AD9
MVDRGKSEVMIGDYLLSGELGRGSFAMVYKGVHKRTGEVVAVKSVPREKFSGKILENLEHEISILRKIQHPNIVKLIDHYTTDSGIHLIMEFCALGDLSSYIRKHTRGLNSAAAKAKDKRPMGLPEPVLRHFLRQLASALQFLRSMDIIHRDIKPQNLLLTPGASPADFPTLKVADFGFARPLSIHNLAETLCGSPLYMAPEVLSGNRYDAKADLWSVGVVLYEMLTGRPPFNAQNHVELLKRIEQRADKLNFPLEVVEDKAKTELTNLSMRLLKRDPVERITFEELFSTVMGEMLKHQSLTRVPTTSPGLLQLVRSVMMVEGGETPPFALSLQTLEEHALDMEKSGKLPNITEQPNIAPFAAVQPEAFDSRKLAERRTPTRGAGIGQWQRWKMRVREDEEEEYVVVEKNEVEVNALADEIVVASKEIVAGRPSHEQVNYLVPFSPGLIAPRLLPGYLGNLLVPRQILRDPIATKQTSLMRALAMAARRLYGTGEIANISAENLEPTLDAEELTAINGMRLAIEKSKAVVMASEALPSVAERLSLYLKALDIIQSGIGLINAYWSTYGSQRGASIHLISTVQLARDQYNLYLDQAEIATHLLSKLQNSQNFGQASEGAIWVEKLLFYLAIKYGREAALNEMENRLHESEQTYQRVIWLLYALLDEAGREELGEAERSACEQYIQEIELRLSGIRKKLGGEPANSLIPLFRM